MLTESLAFCLYVVRLWPPIDGIGSSGGPVGGEGCPALEVVCSGRTPLEAACLEPHLSVCVALLQVCLESRRSCEPLACL